MDHSVDIQALISHLVRADGFNKCRICLGDTNEGAVHLSDAIMKDEAENVSLGILIESVTNVQICEEIDYPKGVCTLCVNSVIAAYKFQTLVTKSCKIWTTAIEKLLALPEPTSNVKSLTIVFDHELNSQILTNIEYKKNKTSQPVKRKLNKIIKNKNSADYKCDDCGKQFTSPFNLSNHLKNNAKKEACQFCGLKFDRSKELLHNHIKNEHKQAGYLCKLCSFMSNNAVDLESHKKTKHKTGALKCGQCDRSFERALSLEVHSQLHALRTCRFCHKLFSSLSCYKHHTIKCQPGFDTNSKKETNKKPALFHCDHCQKTYNNRPQLKNHILWIHMKVMPFQCQWCGKKFYSKNRLTEHKVVHTRERNFQCDICGLKFVSKMAAVYHRRRHTGEKPYKCECGDAFISSSRRLDHQKRRHGIGKRVKCDQCSASFVRSSELKKHNEKMHDIKKLQIVLIP